MCHGGSHVIRRERLWTIFCTGKLQWGSHGLLGAMCIVLTECSRRSIPINEKLSNSALSLLIFCQILNWTLARRANRLLGQVPLYTQIIPGVVAPHKEAFRRTIGSMYYLISRVVCHIVFQQLGILDGHALAQFYLSLATIVWQWYSLVPGFNLAVLNGNTWIFVIPIFVGVSGDLWQYINGDVISIPQLLQVQLTGLLLAFGFTLAFRKYIPMPIVYAIATVAVWDLIRQGYRTIYDAQFK